MHTAYSSLGPYLLVHGAYANGHTANERKWTHTWTHTYKRPHQHTHMGCTAGKEGGWRTKSGGRQQSVASRETCRKSPRVAFCSPPYMHSCTKVHRQKQIEIGGALRYARPAPRSRIRPIAAAREGHGSVWRDTEREDEGEKTVTETAEPAPRNLISLGGALR